MLRKFRRTVNRLKLRDLLSRISAELEIGIVACCIDIFGGGFLYGDLRDLPNNLLTLFAVVIIDSHNSLAFAMFGP